MYAAGHVQDRAEQIRIAPAAGVDVRRPLFLSEGGVDMVADSPEMIRAFLQQVQQRRESRAAFELTPALSARLTDAAVAELLVCGLPMAGGIERRIVRSRGRGAAVSAKIRYREGVRMLDHFTTGRGPLTDSEFWRLADACDLCMEALKQDGEEARFRFLYDWLCRNVRYAHTSPGLKGYERLVGAAGVLEGRQANCQGFADTLYLLCGVCGIPCEICCGRGEKRLHVWNRVCIGGVWQEADASRGARMEFGIRNSEL